MFWGLLKIIELLPRMNPFHEQEFPSFPNTPSKYVDGVRILNLQSFGLPLLSAIPLLEIAPVFLRVDPLQFRWYGLMYLLGLAGAYFLIKARARATQHLPLSKEQPYDLIVFAALGVFLGGRIGYTLFYTLAITFSTP